MNNQIVKIILFVAITITLIIVVVYLIKKPKSQKPSTPQENIPKMSSNKTQTASNIDSLDIFGSDDGYTYMNITPSSKKNTTNETTSTKEITRNETISTNGTLINEVVESDNKPSATSRERLQ